jgi:hypothetical protein
MQTIALSEAALALFRRRISGERVEVADDNRALYRELEAAGLMEPRHSFIRGNDGHYRLTEAGAKLRHDVLNGRASHAPFA